MNPINWIRRKALMWAASIADKRSSLAFEAARVAYMAGHSKAHFRHFYECRAHEARAAAYRAKAESLK